MTMHFSLDEFVRSDTAAARGIDNTLPTDLVPAATATLLMLERIRAFLSEQAGRDVPVRITSGYRSLALNTAVGGVATSDHVAARAADIEAPAFGTPLDVCRALAPVVSVLGIGQLIYECPAPGRVWTHVSTRTPVSPVNRLLTISSAGTTPGIFKV
jgi:hypothetical protein